MRIYTNLLKVKFPIIISLTVVILILTLTMVISNIRREDDAQPAITQAAGQIAWPMFNGDAQKSGTNNAEPLINKNNLTTLQQLWQVNVSSDGSPVYLSNVATSQGTRNLVFVTTKSGTITAIDEANGQEVWSQTPTGNSGTITTSPAIDPSFQFVYSYGMDGKVHKYAVGTGVEDTTNGWPLIGTLSPDIEKESSALTIGNGYLYVTFAAYPGDNGAYVGHIVGKNLTSGAVVVFNFLCTSTKQLINKNCSSNSSGNGAGVWARPGAVIDPGTGNVFVSAGNGPYNPPSDLADSIVELSPDLSSVIDSYTPQNFQNLQDQDADLGSTAPAIIPGMNLAIQGGKDNKVRVMNLKNLSGQSGPYHTGGELQTISVDCNIFSHPLSWVDSANATWVFVTDTCQTLYAYKLANNQLQQAYKISSAGESSPLMINGILFIQGTGTIKALDPATGNTMWTGQVGSQHWQSPAIINGHVFVLDDDGKLTAFGVPNSGSSPSPSTQPTLTFVCGGSNNNICVSGTPVPTPTGGNATQIPTGSNPTTAPTTATIVTAGQNQPTVPPGNVLPTAPPANANQGNVGLFQMILNLIAAIIAFILKLFLGK